MGESSLAVTAGSGVNLRTYQRSVGGTTVDEQAIQQAAPYLATYSVVTPALSIAVANSHVLQLTAGTALPVQIMEIEVYVAGTATAAGYAQFELLRLSTAGTGGAAVTPRPLDSTDSAAGLAAQTLPGTATKGTEDVTLWGWYAAIPQSAGAGGSLLFSHSWEDPRSKPPVIPAEGLVALKCVTAFPAGTVRVVAKCVESAG